MTRADNHELVSGRATITADLLLRPNEKGIAVDFLGEASQKLASALQALLQTWGAKQLEIVSEQPSESTPAAWRNANAQPVFWQFDLVGFREHIEFSTSRAMMLQLIDLYYGGSGAALIHRDKWSLAELRFADNMGQMLAEILAQPWHNLVTDAPVFRCFLTDTPKSGAANWANAIVSQNFQIMGLGKRPEKLSWAIAMSDLDHIAEAQVAADRPQSRTADSAWLAKLHQSLNNVTLPVRSVLARPEVSLGQMLALQIGDIIPLKMPEHAPITVAGYQFASGTIGETNGQCAICIEKVKKGAST